MSDLRIAYDDTEVVHGVSFDLPRGTRLGIVGESGSGKSTVARAILGLLPPEGRVTDGSIRLLETDVIALSDKQMNHLRGRVVSLVFQDPLTSLDPVKTIGSQIAEAIRQHQRDLSKAEVRRHCVQLLDEVGVADAERRLKQYPHEFSGGMRQRVLIAIAIANQPDVLIADEPTTALDVTTQAQVLDLLRTTAERHQMSVVLVTHDLGVVAEFCDEVVVMKEGHVVETGAARDVFARPREDYTRHLLECIPRPGDRRAGPEIPYTAGMAPATALEVTGLRKHYGRGTRNHEVLRDVDLTVHVGETVGIVGESGAGKSTLARTVIRLEDSTAGSVRLGGADLANARRRELRRLRRNIQMVFQDPFSSLDPHMRVEAIVAQPLLVHGLATSADARVQAAEMLSHMGLGHEYLHRLPRSLSGGQRQRVAIARALVVRPAVAVLDEPISALDVSVRAQVLGLLRAEQLAQGTAYLFIVHDLAVARYFCDRIAVLFGGQVVEQGSPEEIFQRPRHAYTRRLLSAIPDPWKHLDQTEEDA
ncbi:dipeptide ABC transporter ATP-binding protein [Pedococcus sp. P5_B7]